MKKIAFIGCSKNKANCSCPAEEMYHGQLFRKAMAYCKKEGFQEIYILSAKYGLLPLHQIIEPYDLTLNDFSKKDLKEWSNRVKKQISDSKIKGEFHFFCGENYHLYFEGIKPLQGLPLGMQLKWFNERLSRQTTFF